MHENNMKFLFQAAGCTHKAHRAEYDNIRFFQVSKKSGFLLDREYNETFSMKGQEITFYVYRKTFSAFSFHYYASTLFIKP